MSPQKIAPLTALLACLSLSTPGFATAPPLIRYPLYEGNGTALKDIGSSGLDLVSYNQQWTPHGEGVGGVGSALRQTAPALNYAGRGENTATGSTLDGLTSYTITGWFKMDSSQNGGRLLCLGTVGGDSLQVHLSSDSFTVQNIVQGVSSKRASTITVPFVGRGWIFFAITVDSTAPNFASGVKFYLGSETEATVHLPNSSASQGTIAGMALGDSEKLVLANALNAGTPANNRALIRTDLSDIRIYGAKGGSGGALDAATLETIRREARLIVRYRLNEGTGTTLADSGAAGLPLSSQGQVWDGQNGSGYVLLQDAPGLNRADRAENAATGDTFDGLSSYTITGWFKMNAAQNGGRLLSLGTAGGDSLQLHLKNDSFTIQNTTQGTSSKKSSELTDPFPGRGWVFFAIAVDSTATNFSDGVKFYVGSSMGLLHLPNASGGSGTIAGMALGDSGKIVLGNVLQAGTPSDNRALINTHLSDIRIYGARNGSGGALDAALLEAISREGLTKGSAADDLPVDRFDDYPAGEFPPHPWSPLGTLLPAVTALLEAAGESSFPNNTISGKGLVMRDTDASAGDGAGIKTSFVPPPEGDVYLGFDFRLGPTSGSAGNLDLAGRLVDTEGRGLEVILSVSEGLRVKNAAGGWTTLLSGFSPGVWYHLGVVLTPSREARFTVHRGSIRESLANSGLMTMAPCGQYVRLAFHNSGGHERQGEWALDNIAMAGRVDAPRTAWKPFNPLPASQLRASPKKVFAYYYPIYSSGGDNLEPGLSWFARTVKNPSAVQGGEREAAGTEFFYHPLLRAPLSETLPEDERIIQAMEQEVRIAIAMGLDGFMTDFWANPPSTGGRTTFNKRSFALLEAARRVDPEFKVIPAVYPAGDDSPQTYAAADVFTQLNENPSVFRSEDGKIVLSKWYSEAKLASWWQDALTSLGQRAIDTTFLPHFNSYSALSSFAPFSYGMAHWGNRTPTQTPWISTASQHTSRVVAPICSHDVRTRNCTFYEGSNLDTLRFSWGMAINQDAEWALLNTWSDYTEQAMAPSTSIGFSLADLNAYYIQWFKTGTAPVITRDVLYYSYRIHHTSVNPGRGVEWSVVSQGTYTAPLNQIELLAFLVEPGVLEVRVGNQTYRQDAPAGLTSFKVPLPPDTRFVPAFSLWRNGILLIDGKGRASVLDTVEYPNLLYHSGVLGTR
jgi:hypothetical protein